MKFKNQISYHLFIYIIIFSLFFSRNINAEETKFPNLTKEYWDDAQNEVKSKRFRGISGTILGVSLLGLSIPLFKNIDNNPSKYYGLTLMDVIAGIALGGHGIGSIILGNEEKYYAQKFSTQFSGNNEPSLLSQKQVYLYQKRINKVKVAIFSGFLITEGVIALSSGFAQLAVNRKDFENTTLKPARPMILGSSLIMLGTLGFIRSSRGQKKIEDSIFKKPQDYLPDSPFTSKNRNKKSKLALKKTMGIVSFTCGSILSGFSIWQAKKMFSSSFDNSNKWYYDPDKACPAFVTSLSAGAAMLVLGSKAIRDANVFQKREKYLTNTSVQFYEIPVRIGYSFTKRTLYCQALVTF